MILQHRDTLWDLYQSLSGQIKLYESLAMSQISRDMIWTSHSLTKCLTVDEGKIATEQAHYLASLGSGFSVAGESDLKKPLDFNLCIRYLENKLEFDAGVRDQLLLPFTGKERIKRTRQLETQRLGIKHYIHELQNKEFIDRLPDVIHAYQDTE